MSWIGRTASLNSLKVFEAAARHLSFTAAARELHSTQSAVSQQIRGLEEQLGLVLFDRIYRGVRLTDAGQTLFASVQDGFATIDRTIDRLRQRDRHPHVNILTDFSFAAFWLMPRLPLFRQRHPDIDVQIVTNQGVLDWQTHDVDVAVLFCDEGSLAGDVPLLFREEVLPLCSPGFLLQHGPITDVQSLSQAPLLTLTAEQGQRWLDWPRYFGLLGYTGYPHDAELTFNNYTLLIQAAIAGQGVAIGWRGLVEDMLENGILVGLPELGVQTARGYGLIDARPGMGSAAKRAFMEWMLESVG